MPEIDFAALADAAPAPEKRGASEARAPALASRDEAGRRKIVKLLQRALGSYQDDPVAAAKLALQALDLDPDFAQSNHVLAFTLDRLGCLTHAISFYERAWRLAPNDAELHHNIALCAWRLDMLPAAERFAREALALDPEHQGALINLAGILRDQSRFDEAIEVLREAVLAAPDRADFWNALGVVLLEAADPEASLTFFAEALRLAPGYARAWHNQGYAYSMLGQADAALTSIEQALAQPNSAADRASMVFARGQARLSLGDFDGGWSDLEIRTEPVYHEATRFLEPAPRWDGTREIVDKRVLLIGEQGVGDEVMFLNVVDDLVDAVGPRGSVSIACEPRLAPLVARSFPDLEVGPHATVRCQTAIRRSALELGAPGKVDLWAPMATPLRRFRRSLDDFPARGGRLVADPERVAAFRAELDALPTGLKVGLCWKSRLMSAKRLKYFCAFEAWASALKVPGVTWVSLQYGDVAAEIETARRDYGVTIHRLAGLDLMDDLDGVAALGAALDLAIGPLNASTNLAAAVGGEVWFLTPLGHWPLFGSDRLAWYPTSRAFSPARYGAWDGAIERLASTLGERVARRAA